LNAFVSRWLAGWFCFLSLNNDEEIKSIYRAALYFFLVISLPSSANASVPVAPVLTLYQFNGPLEIPYYNIDSFLKSGTSSPAGYLTQGSSVIPCVVIRDNQPLTDKSGTPFVGFQVVIDAGKAPPDSADILRTAFRKRLSMTASNHHCDGNVKNVIDVRKLHFLDEAPFFDPPITMKTNKEGYPGHSNLDQIVREFHNSSSCGTVNLNLIRRRMALEKAWEQFIQDNNKLFPVSELNKARHLDYTMRTAIFEGHLDRGCNSYGGCERNIIALTIRNRAKEHCLKRQGCLEQGDYKSVATKVLQYNIWDEYLTQVTGITSCFLRNDLVNTVYNDYSRLQRMYEQNIADIESILFGEDDDLQRIFLEASLKDLKMLRHYYHAPAMSKCFPQHDSVKYVTGAIARKNDEYILLANKRIRIDRQADNGYFFRDFIVHPTDKKDDVQIVDNYPGFVVDGRKVTSKTLSRCVPYGIPAGCIWSEVGRYRRMPPWHRSGKNIELMCRINERGESCQNSASLKSVKVGSCCDTQMRLITGVK
jgi:hypothetical protein